MLIVFVAFGIFDEFIHATHLRVKNKKKITLEHSLIFLKLTNLDMVGILYTLVF